MKYSLASISLLLSSLTMAISVPVLAGKPTEPAGVFYGLRSVGDTYQVIAKATDTPMTDISLSGQVTLKVPHAINKADRFEVVDINSQIEGIQWIESSRVDAPEEDPTADYLSFSFVDITSSPDAFHWQANEEKVLFSFYNPNLCSGDVQLMANSDPFNQLPNSFNTNPGNQFNNLGWGSVADNHYLGNLDSNSAACPK